MRITLMLVLCAGTTFAQSVGQEFFTGGSVNGRFWNLLDNGGKLAYFAGFSDGAAAFSVKMDEAKAGGEQSAKQKNPLTDREFKRSVSILSKTIVDTSKFRPHEVFEEIDEFYKDPANLRIPVPQAYSFAKQRLEGADELEIRKNVEAFRRLLK